MSKFFTTVLAVALFLCGMQQARAQTLNQTYYAIPLAGVYGGASPYHYVTTASTNSVLIKAGRSAVYTINAVNSNAWPVAFLHVYDKATAPVCGTDVPVHSYMLTQNLPLNIVQVTGINFNNGIGFCVTGGLGDTDATAGPANVALNVNYR